MNKGALRDAVLEALRAEHARQAAAVALARDEASHEESRARSKYDTHSQEAAYLAEGQAKLVLEVEAAIAAFSALPLKELGTDDPVALGAWVRVSLEGRVQHYLVGPRAGGLEAIVEGREFLVVTPTSPIGRAILGRRIGSEIEVPGRRGATRGRIEALG